MNKISSMGYFGGVHKVSRGPWFRSYWVEDDGMDWFYSFIDSDGNKCYLLSNNMAVQDRENMTCIYKTMQRNNRLSWFAGLWLGFETATKVGYFKNMALGWKAVSCLGLGYLYKSALISMSGDNYAPVFGAYLRKYSDNIKRDMFEIKDAKKQYFYIDTSEYMNYSNKDLGDKYSVHHGPQPVSLKFIPNYLIFTARRVHGQLISHRGRQVPCWRGKQSQRPQEILQLPIRALGQELPIRREGSRSYAQKRVKMKKTILLCGKVLNS
jgi:hypothetical protein